MSESTSATERGGPRPSNQAQAGPVTRWLSTRSDVAFSLFAISAAFTTYFCMYAFRKPFSSGTFEGSVELPGLDPINYKIALVIAQVLGYCLSKFIGIKVISEMEGRGRGRAILALIVFAELSLLGLALAPRPWGILFLFLNGLPLGMVWGLVFGFLEGRRVSEALGAGLSASYIVASMAMKTVGLWWMQAGVPEVWMPLVTGLCFAPILMISVWALSQLPPPTAQDEAARTRRDPMDAATRRRFVRSFAPGLIALTFLYMLLTAYRDFRDNFARELWDAVGFDGKPAMMTKVEIVVAAGVMIALALIMRVKDNRRALAVIHGVMLSGALLVGASTWAFQAKLIAPQLWMGGVGLGLYLAYVPYGCVLFDRLIAAVGFVATAGFMIYVTDAFGYLGVVGVLLYKTLGQAELSWLEFFYAFSYVTAGVASACFVFSGLYFWRRGRSFGAQARGRGLGLGLDEEVA